MAISQRGFENYDANRERYFPVSHTDFSGLIEHLRKKGIKRGFGDYWVSYAITFQTDEEIILEPVVTNYLPYYLPLVNREANPVYIEFQNELDMNNLPDRFQFYGNEYLNKGHEIYKNLVIFQLEKNT